MSFQAGYAYPVGNVLTNHYQFEKSERTGGRAQITMDGNQALAYGLIAAGVRYGPAIRSRHGRRSWKHSGASCRNTAEFLSRRKTSLARYRSRLDFLIQDISQLP